MYYFLNTRSYNWQELEIAQEKSLSLFYRHEYEKFLKNKPFIVEKIKNMISNLDLLKQILAKAIGDYLNGIQRKCFRTQGRNRAQRLLNKINNALTVSDITSSLKEILNFGNEHQDSLKTFIINSIKENYFGNDKDMFSMYLCFNVTHTNLLYDILSIMEKQFKDDFSELNDNLAMIKL